MATRPACRAGVSPVPMVAAAVSSTANATVQAFGASVHVNVSDEPDESAAWRVQLAASQPASVPMRDSSAPSTRNCRMILVRLAPSESLYRDLSSPCGRTCHQQTCDVCTGDQQDQHRRSHQDGHRRAFPHPQESGIQAGNARDPWRPRMPLLRIFPVHGRGHGRDLRPRLRERDALAKPTDGLQAPPRRALHQACVAGVELWQRPQRDPDVRQIGIAVRCAYALERRGQNPDDGEGLEIQLDGLAEDRRVAIEPAPPETVAQHSSRRADWREIIPWAERAADGRLDLKRGEVVARGQHDAGLPPLGRSAGTDCDLRHCERRKIGERMCPIAVVHVIRIGRTEQRPAVVQPDEAVGVRTIRSAEQVGGEDEDRRVDARTERDDQHDDRAQRGCARDHPQRRISRPARTL